MILVKRIYSVLKMSSHWLNLFSNSLTWELTSKIAPQKWWLSLYRIFWILHKLRPVNLEKISNLSTLRKPSKKLCSSIWNRLKIEASISSLNTRKSKITQSFVMRQGSNKFSWVYNQMQSSSPREDLSRLQSKSLEKNKSNSFKFLFKTLASVFQRKIRRSSLNSLASWMTTKRWILRELDLV